MSGVVYAPSYPLPLRNSNCYTVRGSSLNPTVDAEEVVSTIPGLAKPNYPDIAEELFIVHSVTDVGLLVRVQGLDENFLHKEIAVPLEASGSTSIGSGWSRINSVVNRDVEAISSDMYIENAAQTKFRSFSSLAQSSVDCFYTTTNEGDSAVVGVYSAILRDANNASSAIFRLRGGSVLKNYSEVFFSFPVTTSGDSSVSFDNPLPTRIQGAFDFYITVEALRADLTIDTRLNLLKEI